MACTQEVAVESAEKTGWRVAREVAGWLIGQDRARALAYVDRMEREANAESTAADTRQD